MTEFPNLIETLGSKCLEFRCIYLLPAIGLTPGGSSTVHIYTQTMDRTIQLTTRTTQQLNNTMVNQPFLVLPDYLADLQNLTVVMLINL